jgi:hypothetical protein
LNSSSPGSILPLTAKEMEPRFTAFMALFPRAPIVTFFTSDVAGRDYLIAIAIRTPGDLPRWNYEGIAFDSYKKKHRIVRTEIIRASVKFGG